MAFAQLRVATFILATAQANPDPHALKPTLSAEPALLEADGNDWVTVQVDGVGYGADTDWIGAFAPEDVSPEGALLKFPVRWQLASTSCSPRDEVNSSSARCAGDACCVKSGYPWSGSPWTVRFQLVNIRSDYIFVLVQGSTQFPAAVAKSNPVRFKRSGEPTQLHLALTSNNREMRVTWTATNSLISPGVRWSLHSSLNSPVSQAMATYSTYSREELCPLVSDGPAAGMGWRDPGAIYSAVMTGLEPGARYFYTVGSDNEGWSHERLGNFSSFVAPSDGADSVRIFAFGDMGKAPSAWDGSLEHSWDNDGRGEVGSWNTTRLLKSEAERLQPDLVLHIGDISYAVGYATEWDEFLHQIEPVAASVPWMTGDGNHETNCACQDVPASALAAGITWLNGTDSGGECGIPYARRFPMPQPTESEPWYSLVRGPVTIVMMSTEHDFSRGSAQYLALERMLKAVNRLTTPWVIFAGHRPMYVDSSYFSVSMAPMQAQIEPLLLAHEVDLALWGHHHSYSRTCAMRTNGTCTEAGEHGIVHAVVGAAGYDFSSCATDKPQWVEFASDTAYGFAEIAANRSHLHFSFMRADDGSELDGVWLRKSQSLYV